MKDWCRQGCQAIVDTGTFLLTMPQEYLDNLVQVLGAQLTSYGVSAGDALEVCVEPRGGLQASQKPWAQPGPPKLMWHLQNMVLQACQGRMR